MELSINGEAQTFDQDQLSVAQLLDLLELPSVRGVAIAKNDSVVTRSRWETEQLQNGDRIEIIRATQGG